MSGETKWLEDRPNKCSVGLPFTQNRNVKLHPACKINFKLVSRYLSVGMLRVYKSPFKFIDPIELVKKIKEIK